MKSTKLALLVLLATLGLALYAQAPAVRLTDSAGRGVVNGAVGNAGNRYDSGISTIPNSATVITATTTWAQALHCNTINNTSSTVTMTDGNGNVYLNAVAIAANGALFEQFGAVGMTFTNGIKLTAGTSSALNCQVVGVQ